MLEKRLSLNEAADLLGRSTRQLRRDVQAGFFEMLAGHGEDSFFLLLCFPRYMVDFVLC